MGTYPSPFTSNITRSTARTRTGVRGAGGELITGAAEVTFAEAMKWSSDLIGAGPAARAAEPTFGPMFAGPDGSTFRTTPDSAPVVPTMASLMGEVAQAAAKWEQEMNKKVAQSMLGNPWLTPLPAARITETPKPDVSLSEIDQPDPIRAWKRVRIDCPNVGELSDIRPAPFVRSRYSKAVFGDLEQAVCMKNGPGVTSCPSAPANHCTCGYYGWRWRDSEAPLSLTYASVTSPGQPPVRATLEPWAEVDFYGKVVEHVLGYRAEYQRIVAFHLESHEAAALEGWGFPDFNILATYFGAPIIYKGNEYK